MTRITLGISPCPNDTFVFAGLLTRAVEAHGLDLSIELADVETLNERFGNGAYDASKASVARALALSASALVLPVGAALGRGVGPLLLAARGRARRSQPARVLCPGAGTTATALYRLFHRDEGVIEHRPFHEILPALSRGEADLGVCIHEARFTWREHDVELVEDLGERWEAHTRAPLPLGAILARRSLPSAHLTSLCCAIRASLAYAATHRAAALAVMRTHAQEHDDAVLWAHVDTYVSAFTHELGPEGRAALATFEHTLRPVLALDSPPLEVFTEPPRSKRTS